MAFLVLGPRATLQLVAEVSTQELQIREAARQRTRSDAIRTATTPLLPPVHPSGVAEHLGHWPQVIPQPRPAVTHHHGDRPDTTGSGPQTNTGLDGHPFLGSVPVGYTPLVEGSHPPLHAPRPCAPIGAGRSTYT